MALQWIQLNIERKKAARSYQLRTTCGCILSLPTIEYGFQYHTYWIKFMYSLYRLYRHSASGICCMCIYSLLSDTLLIPYGGDYWGIAFLRLLSVKPNTKNRQVVSYQAKRDRTLFGFAYG
ncbi:hypothetical protein [Bacillus thuringiensis]|uniref:hypothetical protein n=1 Tax=Bacillus thuringiensis TaxID=1428 RepID=UPI00114588FA|nr:hypothetical protein [Bacillus thuringiensis]